MSLPAALPDLLPSADETTPDSRVETTQAAASLPEVPVEWNDLDVVGRVVGGDREMFEIIVRRYNQPLYRIGMAYLHDHALTEDAMQNTYLKAFKHLARFQGGARFGTWLTRIMINESLMVLRKRKAIRETPWEGQALAAVPDDAHQPADRGLRLEELRVVMEQAVAALPSRQRIVYVLRDVQQLSAAEAAEVLGVTADSVKVTLHRARRALKARLLQTAAAAELFAYPAVHCTPFTSRVMAAIRALD